MAALKKSLINVEEEYGNVDPSMPTDQPAVEETSEDIAVTPEQMTEMKTLASEQRFEELGRMVAGLINVGPAEAAPVMM